MGTIIIGFVGIKATDTNELLFLKWTFEDHMIKLTPVVQWMQIIGRAVEVGSVL